MSASGSTAGAVPAPSMGEAFRTFLKIGLLSFGGPAGQIALMHRVLVEEKKWVSESRFLHGLNFCTLLPGPEAMQLATYVGWLLHGVRGGIMAGTLFVAPGFVVIVGLATAYALFSGAAWFASLFFGLKAAVLAVVIEALIRVARKALKGPLAYAIAGLAFVALFAFAVPFPLVVLAAGVFGYVAGGRLTAPASAGDVRASSVPFGHVPRTLLVWGALWVIPPALVAFVTGSPAIFDDLALFFSKMAVVTFGGAYAVLAYVAQAAVEGFGWLKPGQMIDGLALAETTPGPLILVLTFVGFLAAFQAPGDLPPLVAGLIGAMVTTWVTFIPCFLWIFLGAPYLEALRANTALSSALSAISAAVVGVILNLTVWFALQTLFRRVETLSAGPLRMSWPDLASLDGAALGLAGLAVVLLFGARLGMVPVLGIVALAGLALKMLM